MGEAVALAVPILLVVAQRLVHERELAVDRHRDRLRDGQAGGVLRGTFLLGAHPVRAVSGLGGRQVRVGTCHGHIFDHFAVEFEYPNGARVLSMCRQTGKVKIYACSTTMEIMGVKKEDLIPEVDDIVGAASFLSIALESDVQLFI